MILWKPDASEGTALVHRLAGFCNFCVQPGVKKNNFFE